MESSKLQTSLLLSLLILGIFNIQPTTSAPTTECFMVCNELWSVCRHSSESLGDWKGCDENKIICSNACNHKDYFSGYFNKMRGRADIPL